jgi:hypothetical protein
VAEAAAEPVAGVPGLAEVELAGFGLELPAGDGLPGETVLLASGGTLLALVAASPALADTVPGTWLDVALLVLNAALEAA